MKFKVPSLLLLGETGNADRPLARLLLEHSDARLLLASRGPERARDLADSLAREFPGRVEPLRIDAANPDSSRAGLRGADWLVAASSTSAHSAATRACRASG